MQGIKVQFDASSIAELKQKFNQYVNDLSKVGNVSLKVDTTKLADIKGTIENIRKEYEKIGNYKIIPENFDSKGNLKSFIVQLEQVDGLLQKIKYENNGTQGVAGFGTKLNSDSLSEYKVSNITQTDKTSETLAKQRQLESESLALYESDEKKKEQLANEEYNKKTQLEQEWTNTFNRNEALREQSAVQSANKITQAEEKRVNSLGTKLGSNLDYDSSAKDIEKYLQNNMSLKSTLTSVGISEDSLGNKIKTANYSIDQGNGYTEKYKLSLDKTTQSVYNLEKGIENTSLKSSNFSERIRSAAVAVVSFATVTTALYGALRQVQQGLSFINEMNAAQTNIRMITGATSQETQQLTKDYSALAGQLGETTDSIMKGSEEFLRAGNNSQQTGELLKASTMMSKIAGQDQASSAEQLIAIMNGYKMKSSEMMSVVDRLTVVDNNSATSTKELGSAIERTASSAQMAGVTFSDLVSYIGTVSSVTRKSAESIGESFNLEAILV